jgi:hypothetical protein
MTRHVMKLHPWDEVIVAADGLIAKGIDCFQQFNCEKCGAKQTIDRPNVFHTSGICEECNHETDIKKNGCNYMIHGKTPEATMALLQAMAAKK